LLVGQKAVRTIAAGDYVLFSDLEPPDRIASQRGEWAVTLDVANDGIAALVRPGDEVAVIGTTPYTPVMTPPDGSDPVQGEPQLTTFSLFPKVTILSVGQRDGSQGKIIVGLRPEEAQLLVAAGKRFELQLALRRPEDASAALDRDAIGRVDDATFNSMITKIPMFNVENLKAEP
jgi:Flp pilus assembly protein CpaB